MLYHTKERKTTMTPSLFMNISFDLLSTIIHDCTVYMYLLLLPFSHVALVVYSLLLFRFLVLLHYYLFSILFSILIHSYSSITTTMHYASHPAVNSLISIPSSVSRIEAISKLPNIEATGGIKVL
jgi:hypothetical protein